jgi:urea transporter
MARTRLNAGPLDVSTTTMQTNTWFAIFAGLNFDSMPTMMTKLVPSNKNSAAHFRYSEKVIIQTI